MIYNAYKSKKSTELIDYFFEFEVPEVALPFQTIVLPVGQHAISHIKKGENTLIVGNKTFQGKGIVVSGQITKSYTLDINVEYDCCGFTLHPSALYKLTGIDVSKINNKHLPLHDVSKALYDTLVSFYEKNEKGENALKSLEIVLNKIPLHIDKNTEIIDNALDIIHQSNGLISINNLLKEVPISQKTLETKFKKIVGLTPKKYVKLFRFSMLMKKYNEKELKLKELVEIYNFHDASHFSKEFKYFMNISPKLYFKSESEFIKNYLK